MRKTAMSPWLASFLLVVAGCSPAAQSSGPKTSLTETATTSTETEADQPASDVEVSAEENEAMPQVETVTLGAGCFWCIEAVLLRVKGIESVTSGYMGGTVSNPSYEAVCTGRTGHAEVVQVTFNPKVLPFDKLLDVFWQLHDPTTLNRQGPDVGTQYRSAIFYHSQAQRKIAEASMETWNRSGKFTGPIVTEITEASEFYPAESYHQDFFNKNPTNFYCRVNILPKFKKLGLLKDSDLAP